MSMGGGSQTSTVTQKSDPWAAAQPYLTDIMSHAKTLYGQGPQKYFPFQTYVPPSTQTLTGLSDLYGSASSIRPAINQAVSTATDVAGGYGGPGVAVLDTYATGNLPKGSGFDRTGQNVLSATARGDYLHGSPELDRLFGTESSRIMDQVNANFSGAGRYGSANHSDYLGRSLGDLANQVYGQNYQQERANQLSAAELANQDYWQRAQTQLGAAQSSISAYDQDAQRRLQAATLLPNIAQGYVLPAQLEMQAGQGLEGYDQQVLADAMNRWNFAQQSPYDALNQYNATVQGFGGLGGTGMSTSTQPKQGGGLAGALGGAAGGAGLWGALAPAGAAMGPLGWGLMGVGALAGLFS